MHAKRWITALVLLPFIFWLLLAGGPLLFAIVIAVVSSITLWEYFRIVFHKRVSAAPISFYLLGYGANFAVFGAAYWGKPLAVLVIAVLNLIIGGFLCILRFAKDPQTPDLITKQLFGIIYIPVFLSFIVLLRNDPLGIQWVAWLLWVVAWGDIGAYYIGSYLGRHKLCPAVSPKKTIEGAIGGLIANLLFAWLFKVLFFDDLAWGACAFCAIVIGAVAQIGDLFESLFKRAAGVKDSGGLLPGHGGFLDRLDALIFAAPLAYLLKEYCLP